MKARGLGVGMSMGEPVICVYAPCDSRVDKASREGAAI